MSDTNDTGVTSGSGRDRFGPRASLAALCAVMAACGQTDAPETSAQAEPPPERQQAAPLPGALYQTEMTFVGRGEDPSLLHLRLENRTDSASVRLLYRGWFGGADWREVLSHTDSLPVPRAAWRILPTGPVRVVAGDGGEPASVILELPEGSLRLDSRGAIGSWNSRTGQRESLHLAELLDDSGAETGLLLTRQSARRIDEPPDEDLGQYFLVSDTAGNGLLIMRDSTTPDAPVTAWTWFEDTEAEWSDVLVLTLAAPDDAPGRWSFEFPEAGLLGELRGVPPGLGDTAGDGSGFEAFRVYAAMVLERRSWAMSGIGIRETAP